MSIPPPQIGINVLRHGFLVDINRTKLLEEWEKYENRLRSAVQVVLEEIVPPV